MVGILLICHEQLGASFLDCIVHILGERPPLLINHIIPSTVDLDAETVELQTILKQLDQGSGVLILTDIFGATPANIARKLIQNDRTECLAGLNLPMLLRTFQHRHQSLPLLINKVLAGGQEGIIHMSPKEIGDAT